MTACAYCRRTYARHHPTCDGCGAALDGHGVSVPQPTHLSVFDKCAGLMSGILGDYDDPALGDARRLVAEARLLYRDGQFKLISQRHFDACKALGVTL